MQSRDSNATKPEPTFGRHGAFPRYEATVEGFGDAGRIVLLPFVHTPQMGDNKSTRKTMQLRNRKKDPAGNKISERREIETMYGTLTRYDEHGFKLETSEVQHSRTKTEPDNDAQPSRWCDELRSCRREEEDKTQRWRWDSDTRTRGVARDFRRDASRQLA